MTLECWTGQRAEEAAVSDRLLARISFGSSHEIDLADPRLVQVGLPPISGGAPAEQWMSATPVETGRHDEIRYACDGRHLFGHLLLDEAAGGMEAAGRFAYDRILACLAVMGGMQLIRVWNYLSRINQDQDGLERYRSFCIGRHHAFAARDYDVRQLPAACALGTEAKGLLISFLASSRPGSQVENPRQVSAFRYPPLYGPKSPSFSRATRYAQAGAKDLLFISGTASIVGHETRHVGAPLDQLEEIGRNIRALIEAADGRFALTVMRIYLRHRDSWPLLEDLCRREFALAQSLIPLESAICRRDLLVEVDGLAVAGGLSH